MDEMKWRNFDRIMADLMQNPTCGCGNTNADTVTPRSATQASASSGASNIAPDSTMPVACDASDCNPVPLAMAYVPIQIWCKTYEPDVALERGTIFPALDKPFIGEGIK